jgi:hypothetical protein
MDASSQYIGPAIFGHTRAVHKAEALVRWSRVCHTTRLALVTMHI